MALSRALYRKLKRQVYSAAQALDLVPNLWSVGNAFKMYELELLLEQAAIRPDETVLDLGCGKGTQTHLVARRCRRVIGIDPMPEAIREAILLRERARIADKLQFVCSTLEGARLPAGSIDKALSFSVLEHIPNLPEVLVELRRVLKPGGQFHFTADFMGGLGNPELLRKHKMDHFVHEYYSPESMRAVLEQAGFHVHKITEIFRSDLARQAFIERILSGGPRWSGKVMLYRRFREAENQQQAMNRGLMLLASASTPA